MMSKSIQQNIIKTAPTPPTPICFFRSAFSSSKLFGMKASIPVSGGVPGGVPGGDSVGGAPGGGGGGAVPEPALGGCVLSALQSIL
jgi:uncharacterized membrane protein